MKQPIYLLLFVSIFILGSCAEKVVSPQIPEEIVELPDPVEETEEVIEQEQVETMVGHERTVVGSYRSVKGVMDKLSCYCSNGGYVSGPSGEVVAVSFDDNLDIPSCDNIRVTGHMTSKQIDSNGACPAGTMSFMVVESYEIGD